MPALPTVTVTDAQAQRIIAAFGTTDNYKAWLRKQVVDYVVAKELDTKVKQHQAELLALDETARSELNT